MVHYYGKTLPEERDYAIKNFKTNDKVRFFVGTPQTGGYGITLTQAILLFIILMDMILKKECNQKTEHTE